ncbi:PPOX class F420-dependent oxidoreductase [Actinoplanes utahensis]|uniref:Pyridoxamine 5'-phosphate oxidase n=1 Tax=Actinoplanes utahensis TaxID=1869 RepID=A0A0A6UDT7_ACTUT|nr:PPOX class F420-dependent oxidoreductase [Actinoplanes utahensis]KHD72454.1 pyridoxamine 5'-phosphate oxidase [Actinoplanes utahensis]GIF29446.1 PPOX class F420-dependent enzyme [Actinoplanes utahensis]
MTVALPDVARKLIDNPTYAVLTTINEDGSPQSTVIWVKRDGDDVLFSTTRGRVKTRNMEREPRVSICGYDPAQPYSYFTVQGTVALSDDPDDLISELSFKYANEPWTADAPGTVRVVCRLTPTHVITR